MSWLEAARYVADHHSARLVNFETGELIEGCAVSAYEEDEQDDDRLRSPEEGIILDAFSASAMVQVYDALNDVNKAKLLGLPLIAAQNVVFKLLNKQRSA